MTIDYSIVPYCFYCGSNQHATKNTSVPSEYVSVPRKNTSVLSEYVSVPRKYVHVPQKYTSVPSKYVHVPFKNVSVPRKNTSVPRKYVHVSQKYTSVPQKYVSVPQKNNRIVSAPVCGCFLCEMGQLNNGPVFQLHVRHSPLCRAPAGFGASAPSRGLASSRGPSMVLEVFVPEIEGTKQGRVSFNCCFQIIICKQTAPPK